MAQNRPKKEFTLSLDSDPPTPKLSPIPAGEFIKARHRAHCSVVPEVLSFPRDGEYGQHFLHRYCPSKTSHSRLK